MRLSILIPWSNRPEVQETIPVTLQSAAAIAAEVLIVNCGGDFAQLCALIGDQPVRLIDMPGASEFNRSEAINIGVSRSSGSELFFLDTDVVISEEFLQDSLAALEAQRCFVMVARMAESKPALQPQRWNPDSFIAERVLTSEIVWSDGRVASVQYRAGSVGTRNGSGLILVKKDDFLAVQGFNSELRGWGFEDYDFQFRLQLALGIQRRPLGEVIHLTHPPPAGAGASNSRNGELSFRNLESGNLLGTFDEDVAEWDDALVEH